MCGPADTLAVTLANRMALHINLVAVVVAAVSMFLVGALWYSPLLFARPWMAANGFTEQSLRDTGGVGRIFAGSFVLALVSAGNLAAYLGGPDTTAAWGATAGALAAVWIIAGLGIIYLFERKTLKVFLINAGYFAVSFPLMGLVLGAWR
jgi:hypothetical protein